jgi:ketosteroid isomerase-like protein
MDEKIMTKLAGLLFVLLLASVPGFSAEPNGRIPRTVPTVTLLVKMFSELENNWNDAVQNKDLATLNNIIAPRFELRSAAFPGQPTPREESIQHSLNNAPFSSSISQMAAHEFGDVIIVSFMWKLDVKKSSKIAQTIFVVDTWKKMDDKWQVVVRYASPVAEAVKNVPGAVVLEATIKKQI